ncbi:hypothetical protein BST61_g8002 [Cercospora zeina]
MVRRRTRPSNGRVVPFRLRPTDWIRRQRLNQSPSSQNYHRKSHNYEFRRHDCAGADEKHLKAPPHLQATWLHKPTIVDNAT